MRLNTGDVISKETQIAARLLLSLSAVVFAVNYYGFNSSDWPIFSRNLEPYVFDQITRILIVFAIVSLIVQWYSDYISYTRWFRLNEIEIDTFWEYDLKGTTEPPVLALKRALNSLQSSLKDIESEAQGVIETSEKSKDVSRSVSLRVEEINQDITELKAKVELHCSQVNQIQEILTDLHSDFRSTNWIVRFNIFFWYLLIPLFSGATALISPWVL